jgi:hypothetical protein
VGESQTLQKEEEEEEEEEETMLRASDKLALCFLAAVGCKTS